MTTKRFAYLIVLVLMGTVTMAQTINHEPMFGGEKKPLSQRKADKVFIKKMESREGGREKAAQYFIEKGWFYYHKNILDTAIFRFNQAWLLDPENPDVYWGLGSVMGKKEEPEMAKKLFSKGLKKDTSHLYLRMYLGTAYMDYAMQEHISENHRERLLNTSFKLLKEVVKKDPNNPDVYYRIAVNAYLRKQYAEAWEAISKSRKLGGKKFPDFLKELTGKKEDPAKELTEDEHIWGH